MKFLCTGDWHLSEKTPKNRIDDYSQTQLTKIKWILDLAQEKNVDGIFQPGDFFDSFKNSDNFKRKYIKIFNTYTIPIYTIPGQHDLRYHNSDVNNIPLGILDAAKVVTIVQQEITKNGVTIYGAGWEQEIPHIVNENNFNILIIHKMIIDGEKVWEEQENYSAASHMLRNSKFDLIVAGDNHTSFIFENKKKKRLINCGSLMRTSSNQTEHLPVVYVIDTETNSIEKYFVPVKKASEVFCIEKIVEEKAKNELLQVYIDALSSDIEKTDLDFKKNMILFLAENKIDDDVTSLINGLMNDVT